MREMPRWPAVSANGSLVFPPMGAVCLGRRVFFEGHRAAFDHSAAGLWKASFPFTPSNHLPPRVKRRAKVLKLELRAVADFLAAGVMNLLLFILLVSTYCHFYGERRCGVCAQLGAGEDPAYPGGKTTSGGGGHHRLQVRAASSFQEWISNEGGVSLPVSVTFNLPHS